jgi:hypothetical protein
LKSGLAKVNIAHLHSAHGGGLGDCKDQATRGEKRKMIAARGFKKPSDTGSWGTSCLSPPFVTAFKYLGGAADGSTVPIDAAYHQQITNGFRNEAPYGSGPVPAERLQQIKNNVYSQYPFPK